MAAPPVAKAGLITWSRVNLFGSWGNTIATVLIFAFLAYLLPALFQWAVTDAVLTIKPDSTSWWGYRFAPDTAACRVADGACWDFIAEKYRVILFGVFPVKEQWRPVAMMFILIVMVIVTLNTENWGRVLWLSWLVAIPAMFILMQGGVLGLSLVETDRWGGLPITFIIATIGIVFSFPIAVLLALGRRSELPVVKTICIGFIELVRGVPLITILFMASLMLPLFLPEGTSSPNKLLRALVGFTLFSAAYVAEVIRGGLQAIPKGQFEAADAMGLSYWQKTGLIILPQALKVVIPPMMNTFIGLFKDTTLIIIISMFDFLGTIRLAANDPAWRPYYVEGLVFGALIYFVICFAMASYSRYLEDRLNTERH
ncbi:MAG: amino acid ABC transporter permease [Hyphomicrobiaceae bacterium]